MGSAGKQTQYKKNMQNWGNVNFLILSTHFRYFNKQNPVVPSEFVITRVHCTKNNFLDNMLAIAHLYGCDMAELWVTEYSGFMKDFVSFRTKNMHPFDVFKLAICEFLPMKLPMKDSKGIRWTKVRWVFNGTKTIALLRPKIWNLVLFKIQWLASITVIVLV